jgi:hypothetical protein
MFSEKRVHQEEKGLRQAMGVKKTKRSSNISDHLRSCDGYRRTLLDRVVSVFFNAQAQPPRTSSSREKKEAILQYIQQIVARR